MLKNQSYYPDKAELKNAPIIDMGPNGFFYSQFEKQYGIGKCQGYIEENFFLASIDHQPEGNQISCSKQADYIKFHFRFSGKHTTIFNGFGEYAYDRPQVCIATTPLEMTKVDLIGQGARNTHVNLFVLRDFFTGDMGIDPDTLPASLRSMVYPEEAGFGIYQMPLSSDLAFSTRTLLTASSQGSMDKIYFQAKAIEIMCLVTKQITQRDNKTGITHKPLSKLKEDNLYSIRDLLETRYAESLTLAQLAKEAGLSKTSLTTGFSQLFGISVFDFIKQKRMLRAHELLLLEAQRIEDVADIVGYSHKSNFSTAFRNYFGYSPKDVPH